MQNINNDENIIWRIEEMDYLPDTFRKPMPSKSFTVNERVVEGWPSFHVSPADPDGKYLSYEYSVNFDIDKIEDAYLYIKYIVSTPRYPDVEIVVNGVSGYYYPYPTPSKDKEIKPAHALHAAIYNHEDVWIYLPAKLFVRGDNIITIIAKDIMTVERIENEQAVLRLDRMADACGFHYGALELCKAKTKGPLNNCDIQSSVIYLNDKFGNLVEKCYIRLGDLCLNKRKVEGELYLIWDNASINIPYSFVNPAFGQVKIPFLLPDGIGVVKYELKGDIISNGEFKRKKKWKVYTTPHAHTDIGYTHRQWEVAERMCRNIDTVLDMLKGEYADTFSYIIDSTWHLEEYLISRSEERKEELIEAVKNGKFGIPLNYVDLLTWLPSLEALIHNGDYTTSVLEPYGLRADRVDIVDVASATSAYPAVLSGSGVKYLLHADNQDRGPFRFNGDLHRHSPFWWKSSDGSKILTWLARMYCELKKVCGSPASCESAERGLELWLMDYERDNYIPDAVILYGQEADNTDIDTRTGAFMAKWQKEVVYPKLIPSNGSAFFDYIMQFSDYFEEYCGDEGAYWEDGAGSSVKETFAVRKAETKIRCAETLDSLACLYSNNRSFPINNYDEAWKHVLLYDEHTWGAFLSGSDPDSLLQKDQWSVKANMANQAEQWGNRLLTQACSRISLMWNNQSREVVVYNPYSFPVQGKVMVEFSKDETIIFNDKEVGWEEISRGESQIIAGLWVTTLKPFCYRRYKLRSKTTSDHGGYYLLETVKDIAVMENEWYSVKIQTKTGCIISLYDKDLKKELCNGDTLGKILYAHGGEGTTLLGNRPGLSHEGAKITPCFYPETADKKISATGTSVILKGKAESGKLQVTFSLPTNEKNLYMEYCYDKEEAEGMEAVYVDFPFAMPDKSDVLSDSQTGWVDWSKNVLPGACREWLPLQTSILMQSDHCDIQIASPDAFLFTVGTPVEGKWTSDIQTRGNHIYSYVLNNYWRVNYLGKQGGQIKFRYAITSSNKIPFEKAYRNGWVTRQGLIAQRMSYQEFRREIPSVYQGDTEGTLLVAESDNIVISTIRGTRDQKGIIVRLQETGGFSGDIKLSFVGKNIKLLYRTDHQERVIDELNIFSSEGIQLKLEPWEVCTYKLIFN